MSSSNDSATPLVYPDISGVDTSVYTNLLLIDSNVRDYQNFVTSANSDTFPVVYSWNSSRDDLLALVSTSGFNNLNRIGLVFETNDNGRVYPFLNTEVWFMDSDLENVEPFSPNMQFMISLIQTLGILNIDYLACSTLAFSNWNNYYAILMDKTGVVIGASNDKTGNIKYGGDWVLESTEEDVEKVYFTSAIEYHTYLLASAYVYGNTITSNTTVSTNSINTAVNRVLYQATGSFTTFTNNAILLGGGGSSNLDGAHALQIETGITVTNVINTGNLTGGGGGGYGTNGGAGGGGGAAFGGSGGGGSNSGGIAGGKNNFNGFGGGGGGFGGGGGGGGGPNSDPNMPSNGTSAGIGGTGSNGINNGGNAGFNGTGSGQRGAGGGGGANSTKIFGGNGGGSGTRYGGGGAGGGNGGGNSSYLNSGGGSGGGLGGTVSTAAGNGGFGIKNNGTITTLSNSQNLSGNYGPLYIAGNPPTNYNIIINGDTSYGQLFASKNFPLSNNGNVVFGIDPSSRLSGGSKTYTNVLSQVFPSSLSGSGTANSGSYTWSLSRNMTWVLNSNGSSVTNYDLTMNSTLLPTIDITLISSSTNSKLVVNNSGSIFSPFDVSYGTTDISLSYVKSDGTSILDLSVNNASYINISSPFDISSNLVSGDNSLNFTLYNSTRTSSSTYFVKVCVQKSNVMTTLILNNQTISFVNNSAVLDVSNGISDISGSYILEDPTSKLDLSVNTVSFSNIASPFTVSDLLTGDNSLNFMVTASDGLSQQAYNVKVRVQKSNVLTTLILNNQTISFVGNSAVLNLSTVISDISGSYILEDPNAKLDLSVNTVSFSNIASPFTVSNLLTGDNSLNFMVTASDGLTQQAYNVKVVNLENKVSCLLEGTLVATDKGYVPIENIRVGDTIRTKHYYIDVVKVGKWSVDLNNEDDRDDLSKKMYKISAGTYGAECDTYISHYHRVLVDENPESEEESRVFRLPTSLGLPVADPREYSKNGKYNLYHLELVIGNHYVVNGGCMVESWKTNTKNF
jgi:hypothetical protein